jgi:thiol-disulfide isomerase/thioredoxin
MLAHFLAPAALASARVGPASASPAPAEFVGLDGWLNTPGPVTLAGLRGKVVLVEFGTYTCINWRRTLPYVNRWAREYGPQGLELVLIHSPEFSFERIRPNIESILPGLGVTYPVALDGDYRTWRAWQNRAWPALYLLDREGRVRLVREGEGHSAEIEGAIRNLLGLANARPPAEDADLSRIGTGEMYFGSLHGTPQDAAQHPRTGPAAYTIADTNGPRPNEYNLEGAWDRGEEPLVLRSDTGRVRIRFSAAKMHLIAGAPRPAPLRIRVDRGPERIIEIGLPTLYTVLDGADYREHVVEIASATPGLTLYSATFG